MRDDINKLGLSKSFKRYARLPKGRRGMDGHYKEELHLKAYSDLVHTPEKAPFKPKDVGVVLGERLVQRLLGE